MFKFRGAGGRIPFLNYKPVFPKLRLHCTNGFENTTLLTHEFLDTLDCSDKAHLCKRWAEPYSNVDIQDMKRPSDRSLFLPAAEERIINQLMCI